MFDHIVPCGIVDRPTTSLAAEGLAVTMADAVDAVLVSAQVVWGEFEDVARVTDGARDADGSTSHGSTGGDLPGGAVRSVPDPVAGGVPVALAGTRKGSALERRMTRAGIDVDGGLALSARSPSGSGCGRGWATNSSGSSTSSGLSTW